MFYPTRKIIKAESGLALGSLPQVPKANRIQSLPSHPAFQRNQISQPPEKKGRDLGYANMASAAGSALGDGLNNVNANKYDDAKGQQINQGIDAIKGLPIIGGFAKGAEGISSSVRGDGTNGLRNSFGDTLGGANTIKSIASGRYKEAIPIYGGFAKSRRIKGQMKVDQERQKQALSNDMLAKSRSQFSTLTFKNGGKIKIGKFAKGGEIDQAVILGGKGHDEGGNDVIDSKSKQKVAETESHELLLSKTQTEMVEDLISKYDKDKDERHLLRLGKEITEVIMKFTKDNSGDYDLSKK